MVNITEDNIAQWLQDVSAIKEEEIVKLQDFVNKFPFYAPAQAILAKVWHQSSHPNFDKQIRKASLCCDDRVWLYNYIHTLPKKQQELSPTALIDAIIPKIEIRIDTAEPIIAQEGIENIVADKPKLVFEQEVILLSDSEKAEDRLAEMVDLELEINVEKTIATPFNIDNGSIYNDENENILLAKKALDLLENEQIEVQEIDKTSKKEIQILIDADQKNSSPLGNLLQFDAEPMEFTDWLSYTHFDISAAEVNTEKLPEKETLHSIERTSKLLEAFLASKPKPGETKPSFYKPEQKSAVSDSLEYAIVSETLAKVYLAQGAPEMAIKVYEKLALKNPQKSIYFASLIKKLKNEHSL